MGHSLTRLAAMFCLWALWMPFLSAQSVDTGIRGAVSDETGAVVPGATITVTNQGTGVAQTIVSGPNGAYEVRYLLPGDYLVEVELPGFRPERRTVTLRIAQMVRLDFALTLGELEETIQVSAVAPLIETQSGVIGDVITSEQIVSLPLAGRNFVNLGNLTAGVRSSGSGRLMASGSRSKYQQISFDGVTALNNRGNSLSMHPSIDAVAEFKVQSTNYTAEYGGHAGADVQLQLKSGSNDLHGSGFHYIRDDKFDARDFFAPPPRPKPELSRKQFGGVVGGPITRGRTFFMGSFEGIRETRESVSQSNVLTEAMRRGDFSEVARPLIDPLTGLPFPGNVIPPERLNPVSVAIVKQFQPLPNQPGSPNLIGVQRDELTNNQFITRIDHVLNPSNNIFGHYLFQGSHQPRIPLNPNFPRDRTFDNQSVALQWVSTISNTMLNEVRFGYMRGNMENFSIRAGTGYTTEETLGIHGLYVGGPDGRPPTGVEVGFPLLSIQGFSGFGDSTGANYDLSQTYQFVDNFTMIRGDHSMKMGVDIRYYMGDATTVNAPYGQMTFTRDITGHAGAAFMLGYFRTAFSPEGIPISGVRQWRSAVYFQDDWRASSRLTLNLGLRYGVHQPPRDINGVSRTLRFDLDPSGPVLWPEPGEVVHPIYFNNHLRWAPRLGFAYRMRDDLVVRGGYGVFLMGAHLDQMNVLMLNPPSASIQVTNPTVNPIASVETPFPRELVPGDPIFNIASAEPDRDHRDGHYHRWNAAVGYELTSRDSLEVRYVGAEGRHLDSSMLNFNSPDPDPSASALDLQSRRPYPTFGRIRMFVSDGNSDYDALEMQYRHRTGPFGLNLSAAYTLSRLMDDQSGDLNASRARRQNPRDKTPEWAYSNDDIRHRLVVGYVWDVPFASDRTGLSGFFLNGWQVGGVLTLQSGGRVHISQDGDVLNTDPSSWSTNYNEMRPNLVEGQDPNLPSSERTMERWFNTDAFTRATVTYGNSSRNPVVGPGYKVLDFSVTKSFRMSQEQQLQFRVEAFNALNWVNFENPNGMLGHRNFARITGTEGSAREMQFSVRYLF